MLNKPASANHLLERLARRKVVFDAILFLAAGLARRVFWTGALRDQLKSL